LACGENRRAQPCATPEAGVTALSTFASNLARVASSTNATSIAVRVARMSAAVTGRRVPPAVDALWTKVEYGCLNEFGLVRWANH